MSNLPKTVCIESPFRNPLPEVPLIGELYQDYLHDCLRDSLSRGEAPFAGHAFLPSVLNDDDPVERRQGIDCHLAWLMAAEDAAFYIDFGVSSGMGEAAVLRGFNWRTLPAWTDIGAYTQGFYRGWHMHAWDRWTDVSLRGAHDGAHRDPERFQP